METVLEEIRNDVNLLWLSEFSFCEVSSFHFLDTSMQERPEGFLCSRKARRLRRVKPMNVQASPILSSSQLSAGNALLFHLYCYLVRIAFFLIVSRYNVP